jgi:hypothetical protein
VYLLRRAGCFLLLRCVLKPRVFSTQDYVCRLYCTSLSGVQFLQRFGYRVTGISMCVDHMESASTKFIYMYVISPMYSNALLFSLFP